ncbi:hypothetical protein GRI72_08140 [Altererythrobacter marinus]|uniref:TonB C-terminal domain-containing protein n=1 Tax=Pelagerythrobacter marinus TaxID=538382 RepID=A0ABW9UWG8_9SPHN|nr:energy transducer TonB [Pelagerythrobacter marinus]MXO68793.1 hypothetical protein [Pelagerythrobacter marinus]
MKTLSVPAAGAAALAAVFAGQPASAGEPVHLAPSSPWQLRYDKEACRLSRSFGEGEQEVVLTLAKYAPGIAMEFVVAGTPLRPDGDRFAYRFDPVREPDEERHALFGTADDGQTIWQFTGELIPRAMLAHVGGGSEPGGLKAVETRIAEQTEAFTIVSGVRQPVSLRTGSLAKAMAALDTCLVDLVRSWGYDPEQLSALSAWPHPRSHPRLWIRGTDYPDTALRDNLAGAVRFRLAVDAEGNVSDCVVQAAYSDHAFREATCKALRHRARFTPARDAEGRPVAAYWVSSSLFAIARYR